MPKITFVADSGEVRDVEAAEGQSVMEAAVQNLVPGIDGDCGGVTACGTCHVYVDPNWLDRVGKAASDMELQMLELTENTNASSRLACQIVMSAALDGLVVRMPEAQH